MSTMSRAVRQSAAAIVASILAMVMLSWRTEPLLAQGCVLPPASTVGVQHVVLIMAENRSFDHLAGYTAAHSPPTYIYNIGSNNSPLGQCTTYALNDTAKPDCALTGFNLPTYVGTADNKDPDHGTDQMAAFYNGGANDGWLFYLDPNFLNTSHFAIGYYKEESDDPTTSNLPFLMTLLHNSSMRYQSLLVPTYFSSMIAMTDPNRLYEHTGTTDRWDNSGCKTGCNNNGLSGLPSIWDVSKNPDTGAVEGTYYATVGCCNYLQAFWGTKYDNRPSLVPGFLDTQFAGDVSKGILDGLTFIDTQRYHPDSNTEFSDISKNASDGWLQNAVEAVETSPFASSTIIVVTFDEGGGFFDHVGPGKVTSVAPYVDDNTDGVKRDGNNHVPLGFRVPAIIISPYKASQTALTYDHASVLKLIEWARAYQPISTDPIYRDHPTYTDVSNLACALDFSTGNFVQNGGFEAIAGTGGTLVSGSSADPTSVSSVPRWVPNHQTAAVLETLHPHSGRRNVICNTNGSDCGMYQDVVAPKRGLNTYTLTVYAAASMTPAPKTDGRVGADGATTVAMPVVADGTYHPYTMSVSAFGGATIRVWMYAGPQPGWVVMDDVRLAP